MVNLLYRYTLSDDPCFDEFTYGEAGREAEFLRKNLKKGDYIFSTKILMENSTLQHTTFFPG